MDYVEMVRDPELVIGFRELVSDSDPVVVKRTVKVFTSVYYHTLRLLSSGELEEETLMNSWDSVKGVVDSLLGMVKRCDNEGVLVHLVRFLESAVMSHLVYDLTSYPIVFERGREVIKTGLKALKDLVTTPYVGGTTFIVAVRAMINIACLRPDLWEPVTDLLKKQLVSLPPTLFDHNVRSLHKALQKNLFRLLRRADTPLLKEKLIEMMVSVGVPRKMVAPWAPAMMENRKRSPPDPFNEDSLLGRVTPPEKKLRVNVEKIDSVHSSRSNTPEVPTDPRLPLAAQKPSVAIDEPFKNSVEGKPLITKPNNSDLLFLTSLIPKSKKEEAKSEELEPFTKEIHEKLDLEVVCKLVIENVGDCPDIEPKDFVSNFKSYGSPHESSDTLRKRLSAMLSTYLTKEGITSLTVNSEQNSFTKSEFSIPSGDLRNGSSQLKAVNSNSNSVASTTPSSTPPLADTDLRQMYRPANSSRGDVDMRVAVDPRLTARDPRLQKDPRNRKDVTDPRISSAESRSSSRIDPRLGKSIDSQARVTDPRLSTSTSSSKSSEPRKTRWDPRTPPIDPPIIPSTSIGSNQPLRPVTNLESSARPNDPRTNRPPHTKGLLPHPDPRTFSKDTIDPRLQMQTQSHDPRVQQPQQQQQQQPFMPQGSFPFVQMNSGPPNAFVGNVNIPPPNSGPSPMFNGPPYGWQPNGNTGGPPFLFAQPMNNMQPGMLPTGLFNL